jgi:hypothetical protein
MMCTQSNQCPVPSSLVSRYLAYASELLRGELQLWGVLFASTTTSVRVFLDLCHEVIGQIKERMTPLMEESAYNSQSKRVHQNNVFLIRLDMLDAFMMYYHSMYEVCKPDFRKEVCGGQVSTVRAVSQALLF